MSIASPAAVKVGVFLYLGTNYALPLFRAFLSTEGDVAQPALTPRRVRRRFEIVAFGIFVAAPFILLVVLGMIAAVICPATVKWALEPRQELLMGLSAIVFALGPLLALHGTALPAAAGDAIGPRATLARARRTFWPVLGLAIAAPGLALVAAAAAVFLLGMVCALIAMTVAPALLPPSPVANGIRYVVTYGMVVVLLFLATLDIVTLSRAYLGTVSTSVDAKDAPDATADRPA